MKIAVAAGGLPLPCSRGALEKIAEQPFGRWLLLLTALGLVFYGMVQWVAAWYRRSHAR